MRRLLHCCASLLFVASLCAASGLAAQDYPVKPVRILVGFAASEAALAVAKGEADFNFPSITGARSLIEAGRVRPIAVSTAKRTALMPDMPTLHESGVPGYDRNGWYSLIGPAGLPKEVLNKLNAAIAKGVNTPEMKAAFFRQGLEPDTNTPEQFAELIRRELEQNVKLARAAGIAKE